MDDDGLDLSLNISSSGVRAPTREKVFGNRVSGLKSEIEKLNNYMIYKILEVRSFFVVDFIFYLG